MDSFDNDFKTAIYLEKFLCASSCTPDAGPVIDSIRGSRYSGWSPGPRGRRPRFQNWLCCEVHDTGSVT